MFFLDANGGEYATSNLGRPRVVPYFREPFLALGDDNLVPGRVVGVERTVFRVQTEQEVAAATLAGRFRHDQPGPQQSPTVGDWVAVTPVDGGSRAVIRHVLERETSLSRVSRSGRDPATSTASEQLLAANVDYVFVVTALDQDFSVRRIERYLAAVTSGGAKPVVVLNKADLCDDVLGYREQVGAVAPGVPVHALTALEAGTLGELAAYLREGTTVALIGSSGVGKSTLINRLIRAEVAPTGAVRTGDDEGRHTYRQPRAARDRRVVVRRRRGLRRHHRARPFMRLPRLRPQA